MDPAHILVVRLSAMGDILHALPAVATLRRSFPAARITWAVKPRWLSLLRDNPYVDQLLPIDLPRLGLPRFDLVLDFQGLIKSALLARLTRPARLVGFDYPLLREKPAGLFYSQRVRSTARHVVDLNLDLAAAAGASRRSIEFPVPDYPAEGDLPDGDFVLASPLAGWRAKQWPLDFYSRLATLLGERFGWPLVLNCSPGERDRCANITGCLVNVTSVEGLIGVTRRARAVIGLDSGPLHLAAALGKPGVALFGPTDPDRNGPYGGTIAVLRSPDAVTSYRRRNVISPAMDSLTPEQVFQALETHLLEPHR